MPPADIATIVIVALACFVVSPWRLERHFSLHSPLLLLRLFLRILLQVDFLVIQPILFVQLVLFFFLIANLADGCCRAPEVVESVRQDIILYDDSDLPCVSGRPGVNLVSRSPRSGLCFRQSTRRKIPDPHRSHLLPDPRLEPVVSVAEHRGSCPRSSNLSSQTTGLD